MMTTLQEKLFFRNQQTCRIVYKNACMDTLAYRLKTERKAHGLSQAALAKKAQISQQAIALMERGDIEKPRHVVEIAKALKVNPEWLKTGKGPKESRDWELLIDASALPQDAQDTLLELVKSLESGKTPVQKFIAQTRVLIDY